MTGLLGRDAMHVVGVEFGPVVTHSLGRQKDQASITTRGGSGKLASATTGPELLYPSNGIRAGNPVV